MPAEKLESRFYRIKELIIGMFYNPEAHRWVISNFEGQIQEMSKAEAEIIIDFLDWLCSGDKSLDAEEDDSGWIDLTNSVAYKVEKGKLKLGHKSRKGYSILYALDYELVKAVYDALPERATSDIVLDTARKFELNITPKLITYLMHFYARYVDFDAELETEHTDKGRPRLVLVKKEEYSLNEVVKEKLQQEKDVIGNLD